MAKFKRKTDYYKSNEVTQGTHIKYELRNTIQLRTPYAIRLYELLKQYQTTSNNTRVISVADFKKMFQIDKEFHNFSSFYQKVIKKSIKMINLNTDITITNHNSPDHKIKEGRSVVALRFTFIAKTEEEKAVLWPEDYGV